MSDENNDLCEFCYEFTVDPGQSSPCHKCQEEIELQRKEEDDDNECDYH